MYFHYGIILSLLTCLHFTIHHIYDKTTYNLSFKDFEFTYIYSYIHVCLCVGTCTYVHVSVEARGPDPSTAGGTCCCELPE